MSGDSTAPTATEGKPPRKLVLTGFLGLLKAGVVLGGLETLLSLGGRWHWALDLLVHFRVQVLWGLIVLAVGLACLRRWRWLAACGVPLAINAVFVLSITIGPGGVPAKPGERIYRAMVINVLTGNPTPEHVLAQIKAEQPDILLLMEVDDRWIGLLDGVGGRFPTQLVEARGDNFGIAFFSTLPLIAGELEVIGVAGVKSAVSTLNADGRPLVVIGTHPVPPVGDVHSYMRNHQLEHVGLRMQELPNPQLLMGDLNTTSWSHTFTDLLAETGLRDTRQGFGVQPTWPTMMPLFYIPLDHLLVSEEITVHDRRVLPPSGSDHRAVVLDFSINQAPSIASE